MLRKITLTHFKCFKHLELQCAPLNLLCGLNGSGKSTVIQALLMLRQSLEAGELQNGRLVLSGERVDLGTSSDALFEDAESDVLRLLLTADRRGRITWAQAFDCPRVRDTLGGSTMIRATASQEGLSQEDLEVGSRLVERDDNGEGHGDDLSCLEAWRDEPPIGGPFVYVNAERVGPRKLYPLSDLKASRTDFGASSEHALSYLSRTQDFLLEGADPRSPERGNRRLSDAVDYWLQDICPGIHLQLEPVVDADAVIAGFVFERSGDVVSRRHRAINVGFGVSYALPVILALLSPVGTLCLIENPEAHLHPRGQTKLGELAARAAKAGLQIFAETHSDHFMDGARIAVREQLVDTRDVAFHYFERDGNMSRVTSLKADSDGRLPHWPAGFFDQHEKNLSKLISPKT